MNTYHKERIGLFGGTFNPVHLGHVKAAEIVLSKFMLDKILFIPSYIPPHKGTDGIASPDHRIAMVKLALGNKPHFIPSPIEIEAQGTSYSILTLNKIRETYPQAEIFFILGIDAFLEIDTWKDYKQVVDRCCFIVISRPGYRLQDAGMALGKEYEKDTLDLSEEDRFSEEMMARKIFLLPIDALDVASSDIRRRIKEKISIKGMVSPPVEKYIAENKLYQRKNG